eukprot:scaffold1355_cov268-Pinguiococcus_pyrenoidosus.AAC.53
MLCPTPELTRDTREEPANCKSAWIQGALYTSSNGKMRKSTATSLRPRAAFGLELTLNSRLLGTMKPPIFTRGFSAPGLGSTIEGKHVSFAARSTTWKPPSTSVLSQESSTARSVCSPSKMICTSSSDPTRKLTNPSLIASNRRLAAARFGSVLLEELFYDIPNLTRRQDGLRRTLRIVLAVFIARRRAVEAEPAEPACG